MKKIFFVLFIIIMTMQTLLGQGCSDAGFCTIDNVKPMNFREQLSQNKNQVKVGFFIGSADKSVSVWGNYSEYNREISDRLSFDVKLTSIVQSGNEVQSYGLGDIFLSSNYRIKNHWKVTLGTKIPLTDGNKQRQWYSLPMDYQSSLGTFDVIVALAYQLSNWQFSLAWQQPIIQNNNQFLSENHINTPLEKFQSTRNYVRSADVLFRVSYPIPITKQFKFTPSILPIYHLTNDKYTDVLGIQKEIMRSRGLTLNANAYLDYQINAKNIVQLNVGMPFITRKARPDGLTRHFIASLEYRIKF